MASHCEEVERQQSSNKSGFDRNSNNHRLDDKNLNLMELENTVMELEQTVKLQENKLVLKDRYLEEQRRCWGAGSPNS